MQHAFRQRATAGQAAPRSRSGRLVVKASAETCRVAVLGASGYTGAEVVRLSALHPHITITALTGEKQAGKNFAEVFPHLLTASNVGNLVKIDDVDFSKVDAVFCCLPHATTQQIIKGLPKHLKIVDLSADFRLRDVNTYAEWYGHDYAAPELQKEAVYGLTELARDDIKKARLVANPWLYGHEHAAPELQKEAVYGLTELARDDIKKARLVANPGCYPTTAQLALAPLLKAGLISKDDIIIDAKSGVSGAGRSAKESNLYGEIAEGMNSYGVSSHRHMPEIEQGLSDAAGADVRVSFTPHLICMSRGMQSTMYVKLAGDATVDGLRAALEEQYTGEPFVRVLPKGGVPHTRHVRGSNFALIGVFPDRLPGRAIVICVIDNLVKGASGQAMQNLNLVMGYPETTALMQLAMFP